jgi:hypothetical protein
MAEGIAPVAANAALDTLWTSYPWVKLFVGATAVGTTNAATETTRKQISAPAAASAGSKATAADLTWTNVAGTEDYTAFGGFTASTAGTCGWTGGVTANPVTAGDTFTILSGNLTASFTVAS